MLTVLLFWALIICASFVWNQRIISQTTEQSFSAKGQGSERLVQVLLNWSERHDEIYVPVTTQYPSNEFLKTKHKFAKRDDGKLLTQISVARILDQFNDTFKESSLTLALVSEQPLNPKNLATGWQKTILGNNFGGKGSFQKAIGKQFYYMAPLAANDSCLKCHEKSQINITTNTLGAILFSYDISDLLELEKPLHQNNLIIHLAMLFLMTLISYFSLNAIRNLLTQLEFEKSNRDALIEEKTSVLKEEIQQHKIVRNQLLRISTHDQLTGVRNRRHLLDALNIELKRYQRYNSDFSVLLIDLDHFSQINEQHGLECGDEVLQSFAMQVNKTLRKSDVFARYDGEEFAIIATNTRPDSALRFAEKLVNDINQQTIKYLDQEIALSISIGVAAPSLLKKSNSHQLLTLAHNALNQAKTQGRNCAVKAQAFDE